MHQSQKINYRLKDAIRDGNINQVRSILSTHGLNYFQDWSDGYTLLRLAVEHYQPEIAEFLLSLNCKVNSRNYTNTPLVLAMWKGNVALVKNLLDKGAYINGMDDKGYTALHLAVRYGHADVVDLLLTRGAAVNTSVHTGVTPLHTAVAHRKLNFVTMLLNYGASIAQKCKSGYTPLYIGVHPGYCSEIDNYEVVQLLIARGAPLNAVSNKNETPLNLAFEHNMKEIVVRLLIDSGASLDHRDSSGKSLLHLSVDRNQFEVTKLLLQKNLDVNAVTNDNITPIYIATDRRNHEICELLLNFEAHPDISDKNGNSPLIVAVRNNLCTTAELLLNNKADVNKRNLENISSLYISVEQRNEEMFFLLLKYEAEVDILMKKGNLTIFECAVKYGCVQIVEYFLKHCNVVAENFNDLLKDTLRYRDEKFRKIAKLLIDYGFHLNTNEIHNKEIVRNVIEDGHLKIFQDLLKRGFNVNMTLKTSNNTAQSHLLATKPVHIATKYQQKEITELLLTHEAEIKVFDVDQKSPLMYAVGNRDSQMVQLILQRWDMNCNSQGFNFAVCLGDLEMIKVFLEKGYNVKTKDKFGRTALHYAADKGKLNFKAEGSDDSTKGEIARLLISKGSDVNDEMEEGLTPFVAAVKNGYSDVVETLINHGVDINSKLKVQSISIDVERYESKYHRKPRESAGKYCYALHVAASYGKTKNAEILLKFGADIDCRTELDITPLQAATSQEHFQTVELLLRHCANVNICNVDTTLALHLSSITDQIKNFRKKEIDIFKLLIDNGSNIHAIDKNHNNLVDYIVEGLRRYWKMMDVCFNIDYTDNFYDKDIRQVAMLEYLHQHIIKLKAADLYSNKPDLKLPIDIAPDFQGKCELEIAKMRTENFGETSVSFFDALTCTFSKLVDYMRDDHFLNATKSEDVLKEYPLYEGVLRAKLQRAENERKLLDEFEALLINSFPTLPHLCAQQITNFIPNEELRRIVIACQHPSY